MWRVPETELSRRPYRAWPLSVVMHFWSCCLACMMFVPVVTHLHLPHLCKLLQLLRQRVQRWGARRIKRLQAPSAAGRAGHTGSVPPPAGTGAACVGLPAWLDSVQCIMMLQIYMAAHSIWHQACLCLLRDGDSLYACGTFVCRHVIYLLQNYGTGQCSQTTSYHAYRCVSLPFCTYLLWRAAQQLQCLDGHLAV